MVPVDALREPRKEFRVRELDDRHVEKLKNVLRNSYNQNYMLMAVHVDCNLEDFNPNSEDVVYEVIGGNHTRCALQELNREQDMKVNVVVYCNLTYVEALSIGVKHNEERKHAKSETFSDTIKRFRRLLYLAGGSLNQEERCDPPTDTASIKTWKLNLAIVEGYATVSTYCFQFLGASVPLTSDFFVSQSVSESGSQQLFIPFP